MAHPKRRQSHTRQAKRRTHDVVKAPTLATCPITSGAKLQIIFDVCKNKNAKKSQKICVIQKKAVPLQPILRL